MKLTPRLKKIAEFVDKGSKIIDVGTDHGYIPSFLIANNIVEDCIASDINLGPLNAAKDTLKQLGIKDKVELRLGSGLEVVKENDQIESVVIAGMGGETIITILENRPSFLEDFTLIVQPMTEVPLVREYLKENNWEIVDEDLAQEDMRFYEIIKAIRTKKSIDYTYRELRFGPVLVRKKSEELLAYLKRQIDKKQIILDNMKRGTGIDDKIVHLEKELKLITEVSREIEGTRSNSSN